jgi:hypothetical protein
VYLIKTTADGDTLWTKTYGGARLNSGASVQQTTDDGYIIAGTTVDSERSADIYLVKTSANGSTIWTKTYGGKYNDIGATALQTNDGGYIIVGETSSFGAGNDVYLIKTDSDGDTLWTKTYGGDGHDYGRSVQLTSDGGYIVTGSVQTLNVSGINYVHVYLIKTTATGDTLWTKMYGTGQGGSGNSIQPATDGGYIITGTDSTSTYVYLLKTTADGDILWTKTYAGDSFNWGESVQQTTDGGYIIGAYTGNGNFYLIKTSNTGDTTWTKTLAHR